jgi:hypothetical protein
MGSEQFWVGFEKKALDARTANLLTAGAGLATLLGTGALSGHAMHVQKKMQHARAGQDYEPKSFIEKHPKLTGAASLGLAPAFSAMYSQKKLDRDNPKTRKVMDEHPFMTAGLG